MRAFSIILAVSSLIASSAALALDHYSEAVTTLPSLCKSPQVISTTKIGSDKSVTASLVNCEDQTPLALQKRQSNVCGAQCNTNCFTPSGGGPDPNDCHVIADALRFESQANQLGPLFNLNPSNGTSVIDLTYQSCESFIVNQSGGLLVYCRTDWAAVIDFVAPNCQAQQNAHGGNCVAADQRWFIQVQNVDA